MNNDDITEKDRELTQKCVECFCLQSRKGKTERHSFLVCQDRRGQLVSKL